MIGSLKGTVESVTTDNLVLDVGGVGYELGAPAGLLSRLTVGSDQTIYTVMIVREDDISLYGFATPEDKALFRQLLSVAGIGPKAALAMLSVYAAPDIKNAVVSGDQAMLTRVPGIGGKTAQRLILELKGKFKDDPSLALAGAAAATGTAAADNENDQALASLLSLGFSRIEARQALLTVEREHGALPTEDQLRRSLRLLARSQDI
jgi:Holliday junction DNA helicase RuvA